jgi:hypothetical protein
MSYHGSFHATDDGRRGRDQWPQPPMGPIDPAPKTKPAPKPKPAPPGQRGKKKTWVRPDQGMPTEMVICTGKPNYIIGRFCYNSWYLRDDMWQRHRYEIQGIAKEIIDSWIDFGARRIKHVCLMGHTDFHGPDDYNDQLGRARANSVRDELCKALVYIAECRRSLDILTKLTIACGTRGKRNPLAPGKSDDARACNRRVDVYLQEFESDGRKCPVTIPIPPRKPQGGGPVII